MAAVLILTLQKSAVLQVPVAQGSTHWYCWQAVAREQSSSTIHSPLGVEVIYSGCKRRERGGWCLPMAGLVGVAHSAGGTFTGAAGPLGR